MISGSESDIPLQPTPTAVRLRSVEVGEDLEPVAQQTRREELLARVFLAGAAEALAELGVGEDLEAALRTLGRGVDQVAADAILDLQGDSADVAGDRRAPLPERLGHRQPKALADRLLQADVGLRLEGVDLDRADVVEVVEDLDVGVALGVF